MPKIKLLWFTLLLLFESATASLTGSFTVILTPMVNSTSSNTTYYLEVYLNNIAGGNVPGDSTITITFPTDYALGGLLGVTGAMADGTTSGITLSPSGRIFTIDGVFPVDSSDDFALQYNIIGIVNPNRVVTTQPFTISVVSLSTVLFTDSSVTVSITAGQLTCSFVPDLTQVKTVSPYTISITPSTAIPSGGRLEMIFPDDYWPNDQVRSKTIFNTGMFCTNMTNTIPGITCSRDQLKVTVTSMFTATTSSQFQFKIQLLTNPPTQQPVGPITITSYDGSMNQIDQCSALVTGVTGSALTQASFDTTITTLSASSVSTLKFTTSQMLQPNDMLKVVFPPAFILDNLVLCFTFIGSNINSSSIQSRIGNTLITSIPLSSSQTSAVITFTFNNVTTPPSTLTTEAFLVQTIRNNYVIETVSCCAYTGTAGTLTAVITANSYLAGTTTQYTFQLTTAHELIATASVIVIFPSQYSLASSTQTCLSATGTNVSTTPTCTISAPRTLTVSNLLTSTLSAGSTFKFQANSITNPSQALTTSTFAIRTIYSAAGGTVDISNTRQVNITPSAIASVTLLTSNVIANQPANYTFTIQNTNVLNSGSFLQLILPTDVTAGTLSCFVNASISVLCQKLSATVVNITNIINSTVVVAQLKNSPLTIVGFTNPVSFKPTSSFGITIYTSTFISVETLAVGITATMSTAATFKSLNITPSSMLTGQNNSYLIELTAPYVLPNSTSLQLLFPSEYQISSLTCSNLTNLQTLSCGSTTIPITTLLQLSVGGVDTVRLRIATLTNPLSQATVSLITVDLSISGYKSLEGTVRLGPFTPNVISYSTSQTSQYMAEATSLTLTITTTNAIPPNSYLTSSGYLTITIPSEYNTATMACSSVIGITSFACTNASNIIKIVGTSYLTAMTIVISGLTNPEVATSGLFSISSYDSNNNAVDTSTANSKYSAPCTLPCRTCNAVITQCLSCYTATSLQSVVSNQKYLSQNTCLAACNSSAFSDANFICYACSSNCLTCSVTAANCTACSASLQYMLSNVCYSTCPSGYYPNLPTNTCIICTNNCSTCSSAAVCLTCITNFFLNGSSCLSSCPPVFYSSNQICLPCSNNCTNCDSTGCLACATTFYLYTGLCYQACPSGVYISGSICTSCASSCFTCTTYANVCASCLTGSILPYLYSGSCLASCPTGYYSDNMVCTRCVNPCDECTTLTTCTKCVAGQLLYNSRCSYTTCPGNTIQIGVQCFDCASPCLTCTVGIAHCTSCIAGQFLNNSQCVTACTSPLFGINGECVTCAAPCSTCVSLQPYNCTACISNYYLMGAICYTTCPSGTYTSFAQDRCNSCATGCQTCNNATNCTSCNSGLFLFNFFCYTTCPTVPVYYYAYQSLCLTCQPQCTSCLESPIMCVSCSSALYLHNAVTMTCLLACQTGYYQNGSTCVACQLPCKTCDIVFDSCKTCYNGHFLYAGNCSDQCPVGYFNQDSNNTCILCIYPCLQCTNVTCLVCDVAASYFNTSCYMSCPDAAPYSLNGFCTNCTQIDYCLSCVDQKCVVCITPYLLYLGGCVKTCPTNYQSDATGSSCTETAAYLQYLNGIEMDRRKNLPFPFVILLLCFSMSLVIAKCQNKKLYHLGALISVGGLLQLFSWTLFLVFLFIYGSTLSWLPYLVIGLFIVNLLFNGLNLIPIFKVYRPDYNYQEWLGSGNATKQKIVLAVSFLTSYKVSRCLFSRYFDLPIFCSRLLGVDKFYWWNRMTCASLLFVEGLAVAAAVLAAYNQPLYYTKVFLSSIEVLFFSVFETVLQLADLRKDEHYFFKQPEEDPLKDASKNRLRGYSQWGVDEVDDKRISRTRSEGQLETDQKTPYQKIEDDYISVYDPQDYQDVPKMANSKIPRGIQKGKFRKKNKKKLVDLWSIAEISSDDSEDPRKKKKRHRGGQQGYINNYLYWQPPKAKKVEVKPKQAAELSEFDEERIFETIRNKESEFDLLSKHEDLYVERNAQQTRYSRYLEVEQPENSKMSIDVSASEEPLGDFNNLNSFTFTLEPDDLMNLNYARKKHMERERQVRPPPASDPKRPFSRVGGMILKNHRH